MIALWLLIPAAYLLGSVSLEESRGGTVGRRQGAARFRAGLDVIIAGIRTTAVW